MSETFATCYHRNGTAVDNTYWPCDNTAPASMCCHLAFGTSWNNGDACGSGPTYGLCGVTGTELWRESCTDPTWQDPACLDFCLDGDGANTDIRITTCYDGSFCCGLNNVTCCDNNEGVNIVNRKAVPAHISTATTTTTTTSTTASSSTSSSTTSSTTSTTSTTASSSTSSSTSSSASSSISSSTSSSTSASASTSASVPTSSASATTSSSSPSATSVVSGLTQNQNSGNKGGLSGGTKAGIGIGVAALVVIVIAAVLFTLWKRKKNGMATAAATAESNHMLEAKAQSGQMAYMYANQPHEVYGSPGPVRIPGNAAELN